MHRKTEILPVCFKRSVEIQGWEDETTKVGMLYVRRPRMKLKDPQQRNEGIDG